MSTVRKNYTAQEKAKIVVEILKCDLTQHQITAKYGIHSTQQCKWKKQAIESMIQGFSGKRAKQSQDHHELIDELYKQIGQLKVEIDWLKKKSELFN